MCGVSYVICAGVWCKEWWCHGLVVCSGGVGVRIPNRISNMEVVCHMWCVAISGAVV